MPRPADTTAEGREAIDPTVYSPDVFMPPYAHAEDGPLPRGHRGRMAGFLLVMLFCVALSVDIRLVDGRFQICGHRGKTTHPDLARVDKEDPEPARPP